MAREFVYQGRSLQELQKMPLSELMELLPARQRRTLRRGQSAVHKKTAAKIAAKNAVKTQLRDLIIVPAMVGRTVRIHNGKEYVAVEIIPEMIGHYLGEMALTRKPTKHNAPGIGATKSSSHLSVK